MNKHNILMLIGCILPLILIFLLPVFGISNNFFLLLFIVLMLFCHLLMPMNHGKHDHQGGKNSDKTGV
ncbi:MAG: hypothetical protein KDB79_14740 [Acidobacteria bacterium]|nr:hypothetical protein [Acidobacteriota bacterium]